MKIIWQLLLDPNNRGALQLIGGAIVALCTGLWVIFVYIIPPQTNPKVQNETLVPQASKKPQKKVEATTPKKPIIDTMLQSEGDKSSFVRDVTIADGTKILVGKKFTKIWEIRNVGSVVWVNRFLERQGLGEGPGLLKSPSRVPIPYTLPGQRCRIEIQLIAPPLPGSCYAEWKMVDAKGTILFPDQKPVYVSVEVVQKL